MQPKLILSLPHQFVTATCLSMPEFASHGSPGSGKYFQGRSILVELAVKDGKPGFTFLNEGGWRDAHGDSVAAIEAVVKGNRTKTALSNSAFSCTPISAWEHVYLTKTGGELLEMPRGDVLATFKPGGTTVGLTPDDVAKEAGLPLPSRRVPRLYLTFAPVEFLVMTNLTPAEYVWYATRRPGKVFRQVAFTEVRDDPGLHLAATSVFDVAKKQLSENAGKKTKTVVVGDVFNKLPFSAWIGYDREAPGGLYVGDSDGARLWVFPERIPRNWERAY